MWRVILISILSFSEGFTPRIIGGTPTTISKHPYLVSVQHHGDHHCGGSIISKDWILTAAHCIYGKVPSGFQIRVGSTYSDKGGVLISGIKTMYYHEFYDDDTLEYDIGLIKLPKPLTFNSKVKAVRLPTRTSNVKNGSKARTAGWGAVTTAGGSTNVLQVMTAPIVDQAVCRKVYADYGGVTPDMMCAGYMDGSKDTCQGDSGGPLVYNGVQIGIVSWGRDCATVGYPGVYTRLSVVRSWITKWANV